MKTQLVESHRERVRRIEAGELKVIGQNVYTEAEPSPLQEGEDGGILRVDPAVEAARSMRSRAGASSATRPRWSARSRSCAPPRPTTANIMEATLTAARAGATTGEWARRAARGVR